MVAPILRALGSGYSSRAILKYLIGKSPKYAGVINGALAAGYTAESVLERLMKEEDKGNNHLTEREQAKKTQRERKRNIALTAAGTIGTIGAAGAGLYSLYQANQAIRPSAILPALPSGSGAPPRLPGPQGPLGTPGPLLINPQTGVQQPTPTPTPKAATTTATTPTPVQTTTQTNNPITAPNTQRIENTVKMFENTGEAARIKNLVEGGMKPEDIAGTLRKILPKDKIKALEAAEGGLDQAVSDYAQHLKTQPSSRKIATPEMPIEEKKKVVITSSGDLGNLEGVKGPVAKVNIDGKIENKRFDDLIESPFDSEEEVADAYDNLMAKIPEHHRSSAIFWAGYDENNNTLGYIPHGGKYHEFKNISPEDAELIKNEEGTARTNGETREGLWLAGGRSRGSEIYKIVEKLRNKEKAAEHRQPEFEFAKTIPKEKKSAFGMKPIHDVLGYAREASRKREKRLKNEQKAREKAGKKGKK